MAGQVVLAHTWFGAQGLARRRVEAVCASSAFGLACMAGYGTATLRLDVYPWPLLGLAIVRRIMEAHGGGAGLTERLGWTTCVTLALPLQAKAA